MSLSQEEQIIEGLLKKDERILFEFYCLYKPLLTAFIQKQINNRADAEEIMQDTFLDFIETVHNFRRQSSLKNYLIGIARHKVIDFIRRKQAKKAVSLLISNKLVDLASVAFNEQEIEASDMAEKINRVFNKLPNDYCLVLRLKYIEQEKVISIAKKISLTFKATESLIFRARKAFINIFNQLE